MNPEVLVVIGGAAVGKSLAAGHIKKRYGFQIIEVGDTVRDEYHKTDKNLNNVSLLEYADKVMREDGVFFIKKTLSKIKSISSPLVIIGIRTLGELSLIKQRFHSVTVARITADESVRRERINEKTRINREPVDTRDRIELSWGMQELLESADVTIVNNGTPDEFYSRLDQIIGEKIGL